MTRAPSALARSPDWPERLAEFLAARAEAPFAWGSNDCCTLAGDAVLAITGTDPMPAFRDAYADEAGAEALLAREGGLEALAARTLAAAGLGDCAPGFAQRGDLALAAHGNTLAMGVVTGEAVAVPGPDGLALLPLASIRRAWSV